MATGTGAGGVSAIVRWQRLHKRRKRKDAAKSKAETEKRDEKRREKHLERKKCCQFAAMLIFLLLTCTPLPSPLPPPPSLLPALAAKAARHLKRKRKCHVLRWRQADEGRGSPKGTLLIDCLHAGLGSPWLATCNSPLATAARKWL